MFEKNKETNKGTIIKVDGKDRFLDITQAFGLGKINMQFRTYDNNRASGDKITTAIDMYVNIEEFAYISYILKTSEIYELIKKREIEKERKALNYPNPAYELFGGTVKNGNVISRHLTITKGEKKPVIVKVEERLGKKSHNGTIIPDFNDKNPKIIILGLTLKQCTTIGLAGERAISIYDRWVADDVLDQKLDLLSYNRSSEKNFTNKPTGYNETNQYNERNSSNNMYNSPQNGTISNGYIRQSRYARN